MKRPGEYIDGFFVNGRINGRPVNYVRRRYGKQTFTWVSFYNGKQWIEVGDPWPCLQPSVYEVDAAIKAKESV